MAKGRSIFSQVLSGLAYAVGVIIVLGILTSFHGGSHSLPKGMMPPSEGMNLQFVQVALWEYTLDHDGRYPENLDEIAGNRVLQGNRGDVIYSPFFKYSPPQFSGHDPFNKNNRTHILMIYETDNWYISITVNGTLVHHRKTKSKNEKSQPSGRG